MKRCKFAVALPALVLLMSGCSGLGGWNPGDAVRFGVRSVGASMTRAEYSGKVYDNKERIDWKSGDVIRIWCSEASAPAAHYVDYVVEDDGTSGGTGSLYSNATIMPSGSDQLEWGASDVTHNFYAVWPAPQSSGTVTKIMASDGAITAAISASQTPLSCNETTVGSGNYVAVPDLKANMVMCAKTSVAESDFDDEEVFLTFYPVTTALEFTITNKTGDELDVKRVEVTSAAHNINGTFTFTVSDGMPSDCAFSGTGVAANRSVGIDFATGSVVLGVDNTLQFTLFLLPETSVDDLTFSITDKDDKVRSAVLKKADGTAISFANHKKTFLNGVFIPEGSVWQLKLGSSIVSWTEDESDITFTKPEGAKP